MILIANKVDILTIGQYLRPTLNHLPIERWVTPEEFETLQRNWSQERIFRGRFRAHGQIKLQS